MVSGNDAHGEAGPEYWTTPNPCAEPMCEAAENLSTVSSGVLVTVKSMIYSNKRYSVFGNMCKQADGDNVIFAKSIVLSTLRCPDALARAIGQRATPCITANGRALLAPPPPP